MVTTTLVQAFETTAGLARRILDTDPYADLDSVYEQLALPAAVPQGASRVLVKRLQQVRLQAFLLSFM